MYIWNIIVRHPLSHAVYVWNSPEDLWDRVRNVGCAEKVRSLIHFDLHVFRDTLHLVGAYFCSAANELRYKSLTEIFWNSQFRVFSKNYVPKNNYLQRIRNITWSSESICRPTIFQFQTGNVIFFFCKRQ